MKFCRRESSHLIAAASLLLGPCLSPAPAQLLGPEFRVNSYTPNGQGGPAVATDGSGNFVVVWHSFLQDGSSYGVFGQRFDTAGNPMGTEFRANSYTTGAQARPSVAASSSGDFVVVWQSNLRDGSGYGIFGQRFNSVGNRVGSEFQVNSYTTSHQIGPSAAADSSGNFVVTWYSDAQDGSAYGVFGQRFNSAGSAVGSEFRVNSSTTGNQVVPAVAADGPGNFVVVWEGQRATGYGVFGQRFNPAGTPVGSEFQVNTYTGLEERAPAVAKDGSGNFVVVWDRNGDPLDWGVFGQRYDFAGSPVGSEFRVNTYTTDTQRDPSVAADGSGTFVVAWMSNHQDGSTWGSFGQRFDSAGIKVGSEFRLNIYTTNAQQTPAVAAGIAGDFLLTWNSDGQDGSNFGVFGRRMLDWNLSWVALGDSYSSGEGSGQYLAGTNDPDPPSVNMCHRAASAYSQVPYALAWSAADFFACSGAVTENLTPTLMGGIPQCLQADDPNDPCLTYSSPDNVPQLDHTALDSADFVTLTIGGNDVYFADVLKLCYLVPNCPTWNFFGWTMSLGEYLPQLISSLVPSFQASIERTRAAAPNADVRVLGYPRIFPEDAAFQACPVLTDHGPFAWSAAEQTWMNSMSLLLNAVIKEATENAGGRFIRVDLDGLYPGHEICGPLGSWFVPPPANMSTSAPPELFHPTPDGHLAGYRRALEADLIAASLGIPLARVGVPRANLLANASGVAPTTAIPTLGTLRLRVVASPCGQVATAGQVLSISGDGFAPLAQVSIVLQTAATFALATLAADVSGAFSTTVGVPAGVDPNPLAQLQARGTGVNGQPRLLLAHIAIGPELAVDQDLDGVPDACDNCPAAANSGQADADADGRGDACDVCLADPFDDVDGDGLCAGVDPCPNDPLNDGDGDDYCGDQDNCPLQSNPLQTDSDIDTWGDPCDACPGLSDITCPFKDDFETGGLTRWSSTFPTSP